MKGGDDMILTDMNTHTNADLCAFSTLTENVAAAKRAGLRGIAVTDHSPSLSSAPKGEYLTYIKENIPSEIDGVHIYKGVELNINGLGTADYDYSFEDLLDLNWVVAAFHPAYKDIHPSEAQVTDTYMRILQNPCIMVLGHADRYNCRFDYKKVVSALKDGGRLVELNNSSLRYNGKENRKNTYDLIKVCKEVGESIVVSSGSNIACGVGDFREAEELLCELDFPSDLIINNDMDKLKAYISKFLEWKRYEVNIAQYQRRKLVKV